MPAPSSESTGPVYLSSMMFQSSPQSTFTFAESPDPTSFAVASHVRTSALPARELVLQGLDQDSGANTSDSFASFDPATSSWRTSQLSLDGDLERYSETWPRSGMTRSGTAYRLPTLVLRTGETESGLLPTPTATPYGTTNNGQRADGSTYRTAGTPSLQTMAARGVWPTPTARDGDPKRGKPTPDGAARQFAAGRRVLTDAVAMWPTPTARDAKSSGSRNTPSSKAHQGESLTDAVREDGGTGRPGPGAGALNPTWVEWLMGFPTGHTALDASEMPSSPKSSTSSAKQSCAP